jgi:hypothetical protein
LAGLALESALFDEIFKLLVGGRQAIIIRKNKTNFPRKPPAHCGKDYDSRPLAV